MRKKSGKIKSSWYIPDDVLKAMNVVKDIEHVNITNQVEVGVRLYLEKHKKLLQQHGVDLWKK